MHLAHKMVMCNNYMEERRQIVKRIVSFIPEYAHTIASYSVKYVKSDTGGVSPSMHICGLE